MMSVQKSTGGWEFNSGPRFSREKAGGGRLVLVFSDTYSFQTHSLETHRSREVALFFIPLHPVSVPSMNERSETDDNLLFSPIILVLCLSCTTKIKKRTVVCIIVVQTSYSHQSLMNLSPVVIFSWSLNFLMHQGFSLETT